MTGDDNWCTALNPKEKASPQNGSLLSKIYRGMLWKVEALGRRRLVLRQIRILHYTVSIQDHRTVTADWYVNTCLLRELEKGHEKRSQNNIVLYQVTCSEAAVNAFLEAIEEITTEDWTHCFSQWFQVVKTNAQVTASYLSEPRNFQYGLSMCDMSIHIIYDIRMYNL